MFKTIILSAFGAGLVVAVALSAVQAVTTEPLLFHAETFENAEPAVAAAAPHEHATGEAHTHDAAPAAAEAAAPAHEHDADEWGPSDGFERSAYTFLANLLMGVGVSAILLGLMSIRGGSINARTGVLWGVAGFFAAGLLPSLGLTPELPGTPAAALEARQIWWLSTVAASAIGIALIVFAESVLLKIAGLVIGVLPHVIGAPVPPSLEAAYPAVMAAEFTSASLVVTALLWALSGICAGWLYQRLSRSA
ncbi:CbtA family protein [Kaistia terrae]|uniref:CbtA family protein n=1 Tax=Kaistia terrae TaxID=537017 RepID=A0ABW0Q241_9HYPH|nr:CbtA family protein [Kaistia terrae]MCX5578668.1 CbtA family protein [Kaistia terrae]